ncbi:hypothetical protein [Chitinophaga solisilvae]|uniref:hypothetical protein n=1 Tax=Chitinophaga solisilvae TaxID=1233460 RepID=UPI0013694712|nr:hypothetical protein [Chitinophaga solisilvae]
MENFAQKLIFKCHHLAIRKHSKKKVKESAKDCLLGFASYLQDIVDRHVKKDKSENYDYVVGTIYKHQGKPKTKSESENYMKVSLCVGNHCFKLLVADLQKKDAGLKLTTITRHVDLIRSYLFDLKPFIEYFERKKNPNFVLFKGWKSFHNTSHELENISQNLYWNGIYKQNIFDQKMAENIAVFTMRQALEIKFKRICGVLEIQDKDHNGLKIPHNFFPDFIRQQTDHIKIADVDLKLVLKVYNWTNKTIHNAENPFIWELKYALDIIEPFFRDGEYRGKRMTQSSVYGAVKIINYAKLKAKLQTTLETSFEKFKPITLKFTKPEAIVTDDLD